MESLRERNSPPTQQKKEPLIKTGCCGFATAQEKYVQLFKLVEVQQTFYQPPKLSTLRRWRALAPASDFEFTLKAWQLITHEAHSKTYRRLRLSLTPQELEECGSFKNSPIVRHAWETTYECALNLQARYVLFQCPASFRPTPLNIERMHSFFSSINRQGLTLLWEPRGDYWPDQTITELCLQLDLIPVVDPFVRPPPILTGRGGDAGDDEKLRYYRLHGGKGYRHKFEAQELETLRTTILAQRIPTYVLFNNITMLEDALNFASCQ